jgi:hypothetical protein
MEQDCINTQCWRGYDVELSDLRKREWINVDLGGDTVIQLVFDVGLIKYRTGLYQHSMLERIRRRVERLEKTRMDQCCFKNWTNRFEVGGDTLFRTAVLNFEKKNGSSVVKR